MKNGFDKTFHEVIDEITLNYELTKIQDRELSIALDECFSEINSLVKEHSKMKPYLDLEGEWLAEYEDGITDSINDNFSWKWMVGNELYSKQHILENLDDFIKQKEEMINKNWFSSFLTHLTVSIVRCVQAYQIRTKQFK